MRHDNNTQLANRHNGKEAYLDIIMPSLLVMLTTPPKRGTVHKSMWCVELAWSGLAEKGRLADLRDESQEGKVGGIGERVADTAVAKDAEERGVGGKGGRGSQRPVRLEQKKPLAE